MDNKEKALKCHEEWNGKLETIAKSKVNSREDLAIAYTPGVAEPCKVIAEDKEAAYKYTWKANTVAVVSDGSAVLVITPHHDGVISGASKKSRLTASCTIQPQVTSSRTVSASAERFSILP